MTVHSSLHLFRDTKFRPEPRSLTLDVALSAPEVGQNGGVI